MPNTLAQNPLIDTAIKNSTGTSFSREVPFYAWKIFFGTKATKDVGFRFTTDKGDYIGFRWPGATNKTPTIIGNVITWDLGVNYQAKYTVLQDRIKADYTLKVKPPINSLSLNLENLNMAFIQNDNGSISVYGEDGQEKFLLPVPVAIDALGVKQPLTFSVISNSLTISIPQAFLDTAPYPVVIDPTTVATGQGTLSTQYPSQQKVARDDDGYWFVVYRITDGSYASVRLRRSTNLAGTTWGTEVRLAGPTGGAGYHFEPGANDQYAPALLMERTGTAST